ncbi:HAD family hydrolase [Flavobacterium beibuense]|uniref:phosphoserine phosphatase n=1 Tax=Flavobacterium beibuense TaxID=657326 RepID=A0A444W9B7_9FLAO|nr:HAD family hydrolase [Flavobacterium beibuense]RYJ42383.1 phosphoserine phosphatase [Flavobacterium beibuense]
MNSKLITPVTRLFAFFMLFISLAACKQEPAKDIQTGTETTEVSENADPLPSWNDGANKEAIISYVKDVTTEGSASFIPVADRIATFDNDGTLWSEQPAYFQLFFAMDRIKALSADHPEWKNKQPYKAVLDNDMDALMQQGEKGLMEIVMVSHSGVTTDEFDTIVKDWIATAKHPTKNVPYTDLIFKPMLELVKYLQANDFKVFIVSGGGLGFMRAWAEGVYGIPKDQTVGSSNKTEFDYNNGNPVIRILPQLEFMDDKEGKPVAINKFIGRKPVFAAGNSDGDLQMLQYAASNSYKNFELYVHHTDSIREWAYDRKSHIGKLDKGLDEASQKGWTVVNMKDDWKKVYNSDK